MPGNIFSETTQRAIQLRHDNPCMTLQAIGNQCNLSRERVRQILVKHGLPTTFRRARLAAVHTCPQCGKWNRVKAKLCKDCLFLERHVQLACSDCGNLFYRHIKEFIWHRNHGKDQKYCFCNRKCQGHWLGTHYGRGRPKKEDLNAQLS